MSFKGAIFDLDGTLFESMHVWRNIDIEFLSKRGLEVPLDYLDKIISLNFDEAALFTIERFGFNETKEEIIKEWFDMAIYAYGHDVGLKPHALEYLEYLKYKNIPMAVATSSDEALYLATFENLKLTSYFNKIVTSGEIGCGKNKPDIYIEAANRLSLKPSECVVFEDIYHGMKSAQSAGFFTVIMEDESSVRQREQLKAEADIYITDYSKLLNQDILFSDFEDLPSCAIKGKQ